ncbi:hypothetical protein JCM8547_008660 [Rhodosporidiobolus lusitaniae]
MQGDRNSHSSYSSSRVPNPPTTTHQLDEVDLRSPSPPPPRAGTPRPSTSSSSARLPPGSSASLYSFQSQNSSAANQPYTTPRALGPSAARLPPPSSAVARRPALVFTNSNGEKQQQAQWITKSGQAQPLQQSQQQQAFPPLSTSPTSTSTPNLRDAARGKSSLLIKSTVTQFVSRSQQPTQQSRAWKEEFGGHQDKCSPQKAYQPYLPASSSESNRIPLGPSSTSISRNGHSIGGSPPSHVDDLPREISLRQSSARHSPPHYPTGYNPPPRPHPTFPSALQSSSTTLHQPTPQPASSSRRPSASRIVHPPPPPFAPPPGENEEDSDDIEILSLSQPSSQQPQQDIPVHSPPSPLLRPGSPAHPVSSSLRALLNPAPSPSHNYNEADDMNSRGQTFGPTDPSLRHPAPPRGLPGLPGLGYNADFNADEPSGLGSGRGGKGKGKGGQHQAAGAPRKQATRGTGTGTKRGGAGGAGTRLFGAAMQDSVSTDNKGGAGGRGRKNNVEVEVDVGMGEDEEDLSDSMKIARLPSSKRNSGFGPSASAFSTSTSYLPSAIAGSSFHAPVASGSSSSRLNPSIQQTDPLTEKERRGNREFQAMQEQFARDEAARRKGKGKEREKMQIKGQGGKGKGKGKATEVITLSDSDDDDDDDEEEDQLEEEREGLYGQGRRREDDDPIEEFDEDHSRGRNGGGKKKPRQSRTQDLAAGAHGEVPSSPDPLAMGSSARPPDLRGRNMTGAGKDEESDTRARASATAARMAGVAKGNTASLAAKFGGGGGGGAGTGKSVAASLQPKQQQKQHAVNGGGNEDNEYFGSATAGPVPRAAKEAKQAAAPTATSKKGKQKANIDYGGSQRVLEVNIMAPMVSRAGIPTNAPETSYRLLLTNPGQKHQKITIRQTTSGSRTADDWIEFDNKTCAQGSFNEDADLQGRAYVGFQFGGSWKGRDWADLLGECEAKADNSKTLHIFFDTRVAEFEKNDQSPERLLLLNVEEFWPKMVKDAGGPAKGLAQQYYVYLDACQAAHLDNDQRRKSSRAKSSSKGKKDAAYQAYHGQQKLSFGPAPSPPKQERRPLELDDDGDFVEKPQQQQAGEGRRKSSRPSTSAFATSDRRKSSSNGDHSSVQMMLDEAPAPAPVEEKYRNDEVMVEYPLERTPGVTSVSLTYGDTKRLNDDEFLNDTLIEFGLKRALEHVQDADTSRSEPDKLLDKIHVFNSFFYKQLSTRKPPNGEENHSYRLVEKWTKRIKLFEKKFVVVPINEHLHWYLAIIVNPAAILHPPKNPPKEKNPPGESIANRKPSRTRKSTARSEDYADSSMIDATHSSSQPQPPQQQLEQQGSFDDVTADGTTSRHFPIKLNGAASAAPAEVEDALAGGEVEMGFASDGEEEEDEQTRQVQARFEEVAKAKGEVLEPHGGQEDAEMREPLTEEEQDDLVVAVDPSKPQHGRYVPRGQEGGGPGGRLPQALKKARAEEGPQEVTLEDSAEPQAHGMDLTGDSDNEQQQPEQPAKNSKTYGRAKRVVLPVIQDIVDDDKASSTCNSSSGSSSAEVQQDLVTPSAAQQPSASTFTAPTSSSKPLKRTATPIGQPTAPPQSYKEPPPELEREREDDEVEVQQQREEVDPEALNKCYILVFDSLEGRHDPAIKRLQSYLMYEAMSKLGKTRLEVDPDDAIGIQVQAPKQPNLSDCGLYLLHFVERFLSHPGFFLNVILAHQQRRRSSRGKKKAQDGKAFLAEINEIWQDDVAQRKRAEMRGQVGQLSETYMRDIKPQRDAERAREEEERREERRKKKQREREEAQKEKQQEGVASRPPTPGPAPSTAPSPPPAQAAPPQPPTPPAKRSGKKKKETEFMDLVDSDDDSYIGSPRWLSADSAVVGAASTSNHLSHQESLSQLVDAAVAVESAPRRATYAASLYPARERSPELSAPAPATSSSALPPPIPPKDDLPSPYLHRESARPRSSDNASEQRPSKRTRHNDPVPTSSSTAAVYGSSSSTSTPVMPFSLPTSASKNGKARAAEEEEKQDEEQEVTFVDPRQEEETGDLGTTQEGDAGYESSKSPTPPYEKQPQQDYGYKHRAGTASPNKFSSPYRAPTPPRSSKSKPAMEVIASATALPPKKRVVFSSPTSTSTGNGQNTHKFFPDDDDGEPEFIEQKHKEPRFKGIFDTTLGATSTANDDVDSSDEEEREKEQLPPSNQQQGRSSPRRKKGKVVRTEETEVMVLDD